MSTQTVAVVGGGVAGMSAAHELAERGFAVTVVERGRVPGGKARSIAVPDSGTPPLPGEHGFRFFPGFYRHLPDTMKRIPHRGQALGVFDNLVDATEIEMRSLAGRDVIAAEFPQSHAQVALDLTAILRDLFDSDPGLSVMEIGEFARRLLRFLTSCDERRHTEFENQSWWDFCRAQALSERYQLYLADGLSRSLVAAKARKLSARTGGSTMAQLILDLVTPGGRADRVLNGPTNEVWIDPWLAHLRRRGVDYRLGAEATRIECRGGRITGVLLQQDGVPSRLEADHYILAVPKEIVEQRLLDADLAAAEPRLTRLEKLEVGWMNGVMFYLRTDPSTVHGHTIYIDSPWALTSISQRQFWKDVDLRTRGDGQTTAILSVIVSDWETPGELHGKPARECTAVELVDEVRHQLEVRGVPGLGPSNIVRTFVDEDISLPNPAGAAVNAEPLLLNTVGSWENRPPAVTAIENLFLASDYVRTNTDVATMEAANEAARLAVNGVLDACGSTAARCEIWQLHEPAVLAPLRAFDKARFDSEQAAGNGRTELELVGRAVPYGAARRTA
jgi:15-cis-phytoene desaturase